VKSKDVSLTGNMAATIIVMSILPIPYLEIVFMYIYKDYKYVITRALSIVLMFRFIFIMIYSYDVIIFFIMDTCGLIGSIIYFIYFGTVSKGLCIVYQTIYSIILEILIVSTLIPFESILEILIFILISTPYTFIFSITMHKGIMKLVEPIMRTLQWM